ncbi:FMN-binding negative transcriptional regulator [Rossellomorea marisflavi]|uniref:FMN-binding negative transcriptional regulator n=1 Tax=Rossellomorea marisflavi TaxID=189381 RepID=UPI003D2ECB1E
MYRPKHFQMNDEKEIFQLIEENGFAILFSQHQGSPWATHLPLMVDRRDRVLYGHMARPNGQWKDGQGQEVLAVFQGAHAYISPTWYESDQEVPTWNYEAAHVYGKLEIMEDSEEILDSLQRLVNQYEGTGSAYSLDQVASDKLNGLQRGIVAFRIPISRMEGKAKFSQHHPEERRRSVASELRRTGREGDALVAQRMEKGLDH